MAVESVETVGRYKVLGELGRGAMGIVYKGLDPNIGRTVALKTMRIDVHGLESDEMLKRFQNEARLAGTMSHPSIVTIYDAGDQDGLFYIAMEFIEGFTLHSALAEQRVISPEKIIEYSKPICSGLDYAHSKGVIHRDVKPANVMITPSGAVKIMDFGIAKSGGGMTSVGQVLGTPNYMSPEQVKGKTLDGRSDLFSFGVILYEMVTGEKPFSGQNVTTIIYKIVNEEPISPRELDVTIHPGLSAIVTKALAKSPDERYQTGAELVRDLENYKSYGSKAESTGVVAGGGEATTVLPAEWATAPPVHQAPGAGAAAAMSAASGAGAAVGRAPQATATPAGVSGHAAPAAAPASSAATPKAATPSVSAVGGTATPAKTGHAEAPSHPAPSGAVGKTKNPLIYMAVVLAALLGIFGISKAMHSKDPQTAVASDGGMKTEAPTPGAATTAKTDTTPKSTTAAAIGTTGAASKPVAVKKSSPAPALPKQVAKLETPAAKSAAAASAAKNGEMRITSVPEGAKVQIDGWTEPGWNTPFKASNLSPGQRTVVFTKPGYATESRKVDVVGGKPGSLSVQLTAAVATFVLSTTPAGALINIDGKDTGKVTPARITVDKGEHKVLFRMPGFKDVGTTATLAAGQNFEFSTAMQQVGGGENPFGKIGRLFGGKVPEGKGVVHIRTRPPGAEITIAGHVVPNTTPHKVALPPGTYPVTLRMNGYKPLQRSVTIRKGEVITLDEQLEKQ